MDETLILKFEPEEDQIVTFEEVFIKQENYEQEVVSYTGFAGGNIKPVNLNFDSSEIKLEEYENDTSQELWPSSNLNDTSNNEQYKFKCTFCRKFFKYKASLDLHCKELHLKSEDDFSCDLCGKVFKFVILLRRHMKYRHGMKSEERSDVKYQCVLCSKKFNAKVYLQCHVKQVHEKKYECEICFKNFKIPNKLEEHLKWHQNPHTFQCKICNKSYDSSQYLEIHIKYVHGGKKTAVENDKNEKVQIPKEKQISKTSEEFPQKSVICEKCGEVPEDFETHMLKHNHHCDICDRTFKRKNQIKTHRCTYCKFCDKKFKTLSNFQTHFEAKHGTGVSQPFQCNFCGRCFNFKASLDLHSKFFHLTSNDKFECDLCGQIFAFLILIRRHVKYRHAMKSGEKAGIKIDGTKFQCQLCPKKYNAKIYLQSHIKMVHEKKYECKICLKIFKIPKRLEEHMQWHNNPETFRCEPCGKNFESSNYLQTHMKGVHERLKSSEKKFKCEKCDFLASTKAVVKTHQKVHENYEKKLKMRSDWIKCEKCIKLFKTESSYKSHLKRNHSNY